MDRDVTPDEARQGLSRRQLIKGGVAGAGLLWVAPVVSGVGLSAAQAAPPSGKPTHHPTPDVLGVTYTKPPAGSTSSGGLPFTGAPVEAVALVAGGLVAAGGAAYAGSKMRSGHDGRHVRRDVKPEPEPPAI